MTLCFFNPCLAGSRAGARLSHGSEILLGRLRERPPGSEEGLGSADLRDPYGKICV